MIHRPLHREVLATQTPGKSGVKSDALERLAVLASLVAHVLTMIKSGSCLELYDRCHKKLALV
jgi:hypothetical protein